MLNKKKISVFLLIIMIMGIAAACSQPVMTNEEGMELGEKEQVILFEAVSLEEGFVMNKQRLLDLAAAIDSLLKKGGYTQPEIRIIGDNRLRLAFPDIDQEELDGTKSFIHQSLKLTVRSEEGAIVMERKDFIYGGAFVGFNMDEEPMVFTTYWDTGKLEAVTNRLTGQSISYYMGEIELISVHIDAPLTGAMASIVTKSDVSHAKDIARMINAGSHPIELKELTGGL
ncbi:hypothetical protein [Paenibacillus pinisoli]|uniref:hypothetical protein n=1 Tax=Paenibacillus pinisoli TaxID=1276110 RepID=UPI0010584079|nr:hypothetical protein [Paenibacillus pinisoli]